MYRRGALVGAGHDDGSGAGGKVWTGKEVKRRRIGDGIGRIGRDELIRIDRDANKDVEDEMPKIQKKSISVLFRVCQIRQGSVVCSLGLAYIQCHI